MVLAMTPPSTATTTATDRPVSKWVRGTKAPVHEELDVVNEAEHQAGKFGMQVNFALADYFHAVQVLDRLPDPLENLLGVA